MEVVIFDVDNTIVNGQSSGELVKYARDKGLISNSTYLILISWLILYKFGFVKDPLKPMEYGVSFIKGRREADIQNIINDFFETRLKNKIYTMAVDIINEHVKNNRKVILVSNAPDVVVSRVAKYLNISDFISTKLELNSDNIYTGKIFGEIMYGNRKKEAVVNYIKKNNLEGSILWSYGDHDSDIELLSYVQKPFATNPNSKLRKHAIKNNWPILNF